MKALVEQRGLAAAFEELPGATIGAYDSMMEAKGDGGEGLYVRGKSDQRDMEHDTYSAWSKSQERSSRLSCYICQSEEHLKRDCPSYNHKKSQGFVKNEEHVSSLVLELMSMTVLMLWWL
uniref:CCHC-type domain-containing protein n=1 Tax=Tanacetum cinerariifolium TaxID=118510 RepID=A0A699L6L7_TANCI|nr:hypothetical protein [Tanacetum cinerariifolium]